MTTERITTSHHDLMELDRVFVSRYTEDGQTVIVSDLIVTEVREKALKLQHERINISCWVPKSALVLDENYRSAQALRFASWFTPSEWYGKLEQHVGLPF